MATTTSVVEVKCIICGTPHTIVVPTEGYKRWKNREAHIQDALPTLTANERELLMSGICPVCWDKHFSDDE